MDYSIGEVAKLLEVSPQSLRNWEKQGLIPKPRRRPTDLRQYSKKDIEEIKQFIDRR